MTLRLVTEAAVEPITLDEAKDHLNVTYTEKDSYISGLIKVARKYLEKEVGVTLNTTTYNMFIDEFPSGNISFPFPPLQSVTSVNYYDSDNISQSLTEGTDYVVDTNALPGLIYYVDGWPVTYDRSSAVQIQFIAGDTDFNLTNPLAILAIKLKIELLYNDRSSSDEKMEEGLDKIINKLKEVTF